MDVGLNTDQLDLSWTKLARPHGDRGTVDLGVVLEECGAAIAPIPLLSSAGPAATILRSRFPISTDGFSLRLIPDVRDGHQESPFTETISRLEVSA